MQAFLALVLTAAIFIYGADTASSVPEKVDTPPATEVTAIAPPQPSPGKTTIHRVAEGETLSGIAVQYGIDVDTLFGANPQVDELIHPGDELVILPQKGTIHVVDEGESLWQIAQHYGVTVNTIIAANNKPDEQLAIGEKLFIPGGRSMRQESVSRGSGGRFIWPTVGELSSPFGYRWGRLHSGIDIANDNGTAVRAARSGRIAAAGWRGGYGYTVVIDHGQGYTTLYAHLSDYIVEPGQRVQAGQLIAYVGETGWATGPHLHFEVSVDGQPINPLQFLP